MQEGKARRQKAEFREVTEGQGWTTHLSQHKLVCRQKDTTAPSQSAGSSSCGDDQRTNESVDRRLHLCLGLLVLEKVRELPLLDR